MTTPTTKKSTMIMVQKSLRPLAQWLNPCQDVSWQYPRNWLFFHSLSLLAFLASSASISLNVGFGFGGSGGIFGPSSAGFALDAIRRFNWLADSGVELLELESSLMELISLNDEISGWRIHQRMGRSIRGGKCGMDGNFPSEVGCLECGLLDYLGGLSEWLTDWLTNTFYLQYRFYKTYS